jgi:uncharacterized protein YbcI
MLNKTKGQVEADISKSITLFEKEYLGRGPKKVRSFILEDMILIRLLGVLTPAEEKLSEEIEGAQLIKQTRRRLIESSRKVLEKIIESNTSAKVQSLHSDISSRTGERIFVFTLDRNLEKQLRK